MVGSNYPPGMSKRDFIRAGIDDPHHHEHEFRPMDSQVAPIIEDGAAIFQEECRYVEGEYAEGWSCEETRTYRFEYSTLESPSGKEWELPDITNWEEVSPGIEKKVITIEERFHNHGPGDDVSLDVDPDPDAGKVTLTYKGWKLHFRP
jgi:hypothetical protein